MILQELYEYAKDEKLVESMEVKERRIDLVLSLRDDGTVSAAAPWEVWTREVENPRTKAVKIEVGRWTMMPEFPGVNAGGKAHFLADSCEKVLGLDGKTGDPLPDDPASGGNATKAFHHFWRRIEDAHAATRLPELAALLAFRDRYLASREARRSLAIVGVVPIGKEENPTFCALADSRRVPLDKATITFRVGASGGPVFEEDGPLHDYWKAAFQRERFADTPDGKDIARDAARRGVCLVTGKENETVAEVHRTLIKGVPGLPPIGGYLVSFDRSSPALTSFGFEGGWNAPVSETAAAGYALALNQILADEHCRRRFGGAVLASWIGGERELTREFNEKILEPPSRGDVTEFFNKFEAGGRYYDALDIRHFRSVTLAANGGRVVVRRWLNEPLRAAVGTLRLWFQDLDIDAIEVPRKATQGTVEVPSKAPPPLSIYALAVTTARVPSEVADGVYDALYRAALETGSNPRALLAPVLQRIRIAAAQSGDGVRFRTSHFALLKLILIRSQRQERQEKRQMEITPQLCETDDTAYNSGRLLAVLDDLQHAAQGRVGAGIVARFYGSASTYPRNVFGYLMRLSKHHVAKLVKDPARQAAGFALNSRVDTICGLFPASSPGGPPDFPGLLTPQEQGRFALGFHQQKAQDERDRKRAAEAKKKRVADLDAATAEAAAIAEAIAGAEAADSD